MKRRFFSSLPVYSLSFLLSLGFTSTSSYAADESPAKKKKPGGTDIGNNGDELRIEFAATSAEFLNDLEEYLGAQSSEWANTTKQKIKDFRGRSLLWAESLDGQSSLCIHGLSEEDELMISPRNCGRLQWRIDVVIEWFRYLELGEPDKYVRYLITKKPDHWLVALKTDNEIELDGVDFKSSNGHGTFKLSLKKETGLLVVDESSLEYSIKGETVKRNFSLDS
jgi:hypothetical protein